MRSFPTQTWVREFSGITPSSSSSLVWNLGIEALFAGQQRSRHVGALWAAGARPVSTRGHLDGCAPGTTVVHVLSPASPCAVPSPSAGPGSTDSASRALSDRLRGKVQVSEASVAPPPWAAPGGRRRTGDRVSRGGHEIPPTCAHPWGQLLDESTPAVAMTTARPRADGDSVVHRVAHRCGEVDSGGR